MPRTDVHTCCPDRGPVHRALRGVRAGLRVSLCVPLCLGLACAALPPLAMAPLAPAWAQDTGVNARRATQALFLAVDRNDLPGVQAAVDGGADIEAKDFNGMQAVDLAIERGYYDIAHYLISVRNQGAAQGSPAPGPAEPAAPQRQTAQVSPAPPPGPGTKPVEAPEINLQIDETAPNPFEAPQASDGLPVISEVKEPAPAKPAEETQVAQMKDAEPAQQKPSAAKTFFTTFLDFFKPPNTTGIVRKDQRPGDGGEAPLTDEELSKQLQEIEAELGDSPIKGPAVPITPEELATELPPAPEIPEEIAAAEAPPLDTGELPPYQVMPPGAMPPQRPQVPSDEAFGDLQVEEVTPEDTAPPALGAEPENPFAVPPQGGEDVAALDSFLNTDLPFNGGVDPDILALLGMEVPAGQQAAAPQQQAGAEPLDPFAQITEPDTFAPPEKETDESVAGILESIDQPQEVTKLETHKPPSPDGTESDPFATLQDGGDVDELTGLLEATGEKVASTTGDGWDVKEIEGGQLPDEMPLLTSLEPTGSVLDGVELTLGVDTVIGQPVGEERLKLLQEETIHKPCIQKGGPDTVFCVDKVSWPFALEEDFLVDTIMYQGTRAIARYDAGRATYFHTLFKTDAFPKVVKFYTDAFGPPSEKIDRAIAPLAQPRRDNPTYIWRSREAGTDTITTLEIRKFDDARGGGFPDTRRGAILLYREHTGAIFPLLSQLELMVLKDSGALDLTPKTPDSVW